MKPEWQKRAWGYHQRYIKRAIVKGKLTSESEIINFLVLALCGEAGELANFIKKRWRGDHVNQTDIINELADIRIYLEQISTHLGIDLDLACEVKLDEVKERIWCLESEQKP